MKEETPENERQSVRTVTFPWKSALAGLLTVAYLWLLSEPALIDFYELPKALFQPPVKYGMAGAFLGLMLFDLRSYHLQHRNQKADLEELHRQFDELWTNRKQLQHKAHTYSGHADKLKRFISDKLLEYIEYDEKFLHFKSIAAEVRHNGVISFDKVQTALQQAAAHAETEPESEAQQQSSTEIREALEAMRYLWDLLDLSTADNLALHIGNLLCECEEHYYQQMLNGEDASSLPYDPVYSPQRAAWRALEQVGQARLEALDPEEDWVLASSQWQVHLCPVSPLLGNENHLVLMLENLLKNAQFFSRKRGYSSPFPPVAMTLAEHAGRACLRVYNRGPHIRDEDRANLFQLGFSTRRAREQHGRGLGLYFVNEIVKGYEGRIAVHNIRTPETQYAVRIELANDEVFTELINVSIQQDRPGCTNSEGEWREAEEWTFAVPVRSVEVTTTNAAPGEQGNANTQRLSDFADKGKQSRFDPAHPQRPHWQLSYQPKRHANRIRFEPLDISGVEFEIHLPTAQLRLDSSELALDEDIDAEVERLDEHFRSPEH